MALAGLVAVEGAWPVAKDMAETVWRMGAAITQQVKSATRVSKFFGYFMIVREKDVMPTKEVRQLQSECYPRDTEQRPEKPHRLWLELRVGCVVGEQKKFVWSTPVACIIDDRDLESALENSRLVQFLKDCLSNVASEWLGMKVLGSCFDSGNTFRKDVVEILEQAILNPILYAYYISNKRLKPCTSSPASSANANEKDAQQRQLKPTAAANSCAAADKACNALSNLIEIDVAEEAETVADATRNHLQSSAERREACNRRTLQFVKKARFVAVKPTKTEKASASCCC